MIATSGASSTGGFSVPSMKPVRSRLSRYTKQGCSSASVATGSSAAAMPRATSSSTSSPVPCTQTQMSCCVAGAAWPSPSTVWNGRRSPGASSGRRRRQSVGAEADDDVGPARGHRRLAQAGERGADRLVGGVGAQVELEVVVRAGALGEDAGLRNCHRSTRPRRRRAAGRSRRRCGRRRRASMRLTGGQYLCAGSTRAGERGELARVRVRPLVDDDVVGRVRARGAAGSRRRATPLARRRGSRRGSRSSRRRTGRARRGPRTRSARPSACPRPGTTSSARGSRSRSVAWRRRRR